MKNIILGLLILFLCFDCCKPTISNTISIKNSSVYTLKIVKYFFGGIDRDSIIVGPKENIKNQFLDVANNTIFAKEKLIDSIKIIYNNSKYLIHLNGYSNSGNLKYAIPISNKRNIFNINSYQKKIGDLKNCTQNTEFSYIFSEQDYLDAK